MKIRDILDERDPANSWPVGKVYVREAKRPGAPPIVRKINGIGTRTDMPTKQRGKAVRCVYYLTISGHRKPTAAQTRLREARHHTKNQRVCTLESFARWAQNEV